MSIQHQWTGWDGTVFDLTGSSAAGVWFNDKGLEGLGQPDWDDFTREGALLDGQVLAGFRARAREVFWPLVIDGRGDTWDAVQKAFWRTLWPGRYGTWRVTKEDGSWRELTVRIRSDGSPRYRSDPTIDDLDVHGVTLVADDPFWRGPTVSRTFQTAEDPLPFYAVTTDRVFNLMSSSTVDSAQIDNLGDVDAWPVVRIDGPASSFSIFGSVGGSIAVGEGEWLLIDMHPTRQSVRLYHSEFDWENVTRQLTDRRFQRISAGGAHIFDITLNGSGSMTVSIEPGYLRGI